jgi:hypothetical protein
MNDEIQPPPGPTILDTMRAEIIRLREELAKLRAAQPASARPPAAGKMPTAAALRPVATGGGKCRGQLAIAVAGMCNRCGAPKHWK